MDKGFTHELAHKIWSDEDGEHIYVGPDGDSLDLVEVRCYDSSGKITQRFAIHPTQAYLVGQALIDASKQKSITMERDSHE